MATGFPQQSGFSFNFGTNMPAQLGGGRLKWGLIIVGLFLGFTLLSFLRSIYTDLLWFGQLDYQSVFVKMLATRVVLFFTGAVVFAILLGANLYLANRMSQGPEGVPLPRGALEFLRRFIFWAAIAAVIALSVVFGVMAAGKWEVFLKFWNSVPFEISDPVYGMDLSFYVFTMPMLTFVKGWLLGGAIVVLIATFAMYFVNFSLRGVGLIITPGLKIHVSVIGAAIMFILAFGHWLDRWDLLLSDHGAVFGAAYADIAARKPALMILSIIAIASGILMIVNAYLTGIRLLIGAVALWIVMSVLLGTLWPNFVQQFRVNPNEFVKEQPYIERNIEFTRRGFGLEGIVEQRYPVNSSLSTEVVEANLQTIDNIRLWDHGPLADVYRQIQLIRPYYDFKDADVDRYVINGDYRQVMLAAREVASEKLDEAAQTWVNTKLRYTHGFGMAMSPVTEFTEVGRPEFFTKDIPEDGILRIGSTSEASVPDVVIDNPRIYYGEKTLDYVVVNSNTEELDYQAEGGQIRGTRYFGEGGVPLSSFLRRLVYAWQFREINILISGEITDQSRIQYRREVQERIRAVAPYLLVDEDPYLVAVEGQLFWIQDAYTQTGRFPYSDPHIDGFNYIRNSVKIAVDAFNGSLRFYVSDQSDPVIRTYQDIFPELFLPMDDMPSELRGHIRYPQDLFRFQAGKYLKYHMRDTQDFYNLEDLWRIPNEKFGQGGTLQPVEPYYVIMKIPGEDREEFVLLIPYTRNDPPIMAGWLAARNDGENYGKLLAFDFPKDRQVDSPEQVEAKIDNDPYISQWLTLRCQEGSFCIRGNLLVIPLATENDFGLLYVEPIYLQAEGVDFPELKKVVMATGDKVVMDDSVPEAIASLTGFSSPTGSAPTSGDMQVPGKGGDTVQAELNVLDGVLQQIKGDLSVVEEAIQRIRELTGGE